MQDLFFIFSHSLSPCLSRCLEAASRPPFNYTKINVVFPSLYLKHGKIIYYVSNTVLWKELAKYSLNVGRFAFFFLLWELCGALDSASPYKHVHFFITSADETSGYTYVIIICFAFSCVECLTEIKCVNQEGKCSCFWPINNDLSSKKKWWMWSWKIQNTLNMLTDTRWCSKSWIFCFPTRSSLQLESMSSKVKTNSV